MIVLVLALLAAVALYRLGLLKGGISLAIAFLAVFALAPFVLQFTVLHFGMSGFWSVLAMIAVAVIVAFYVQAARKSDA